MNPSQQIEEAIKRFFTDIKDIQDFDSQLNKINRAFDTERYKRNIKRAKLFKVGDWVEVLAPANYPVFTFFGTVTKKNRISFQVTDVDLHNHKVLPTKMFKREKPVAKKDGPVTKETAKQKPFVNCFGIEIT